MQERAATRVFELQNELASQQAHLDRCDRALAALAIVSPPKVRTCNLHKDCDAADVKAQARDGKRAAHCHNDDCEDCFGR